MGDVDQYFTLEQFDTPLLTVKMDESPDKSESKLYFDAERSKPSWVATPVVTVNVSDCVLMLLRP